MRSVEETLKDIGIRELTKEEIVETCEKYRNALIDGIQGKGNLPMFASYLQSIKPEELPRGKTALVIELGGSHVYGCLLSVVDGKPSVSNGVKHPISTRTYESAEQYFTMVQETLEPLLKEAKPDAIGIIYSSGGRNIKKDQGNDVVIAEGKNGMLSKELVVPGIDAAPLGELFKKYIGKDYSYISTLPMVAMNDTVAVVLSTGAVVGGVVATGFNLAVLTEGGLVNTESARFSDIPQTDVSKKVDEASTRPGMSLTEKQISGVYLPEYFKTAIALLKEEGHQVSLPSELDAAVMSGYVERNSASTDEELFRNISVKLFNRSAQIVGVLIGTAIKTFQSQASELLEVPVEGSLFWGAPGYVDVATKVASETSGKTVKFLNIPHAGRIGAGVAALGTLISR